MSSQQIHIFLDGTFRRPSRTHSLIRITTIPSSIADIAAHITNTLLTQHSPIAPKIIIAAGNHDIAPNHLLTIDPDRLRANKKYFIDSMARRIMIPLTRLYHKVSERGGTLWSASLYPRPANFRVNFQVSDVLSDAFLNANSYISYINHLQKLPNIPLHQPLQYTEPHPALTTCQRSIKTKLYDPDGITLSRTAQERLWKKMAYVLRKTWGPARSHLAKRRAPRPAQAVTHHPGASGAPGGQSVGARWP